MAKVSTIRGGGRKPPPDPGPDRWGWTFGVVGLFMAATAWVATRLRGWRMLALVLVALACVGLAILAAVGLFTLMAVATL